MVNSVPIIVAVEGIYKSQLVSKVISLETEHILKASVMSIGIFLSWNIYHFRVSLGFPL